jgi:hypothetical protein
LKWIMLLFEFFLANRQDIFQPTLVMVSQHWSDIEGSIL